MSSSLKIKVRRPFSPITTPVSSAPPPLKRKRLIVESDEDEDVEEPAPKEMPAGREKKRKGHARDATESPSHERDRSPNKPRYKDDADHKLSYGTKKQPSRADVDLGRPRAPKPSKVATRDYTSSLSPVPDDYQKPSIDEGPSVDAPVATKLARDKSDVDVERSGSPPPLREKRRSKPTEKKLAETKSKPKPRRRDCVISDDDEDYEENAPSPPPRPPVKKSKPKPNVSSTITVRDERKLLSHPVDDEEYETATPPPARAPPKKKPKLSVSSTITARDERKLPPSEPAEKPEEITPTPIEQAADEPKRPKLPTIKKKPQVTSSTATPSAAAAQSPKPDVRESAKPPKRPGDDLDLADANVYQQLFSGGGRMGKKDKDEVRRKELDAMRTAAREQREAAGKSAFDMLEHSSAMNRFEKRMHARHTWPSPSVLGSVFIMAQHVRRNQ